MVVVLVVVVRPTVVAHGIERIGQSREVVRYVRIDGLGHFGCGDGEVLNHGGVEQLGHFGCCVADVARAGPGDGLVIEKIKLATDGVAR